MISLPSLFVFRIFSSFFSQRRIAGGAIVLALTQFGASFAGLIRDRVLSSTFPPGIDTLDVVSVYISAFRPSDLLFQMFIMSAFSVALVPMLAGHLAHDRKEAMNHLLSKVLFVASIFFGIVALLLAFFFDALAPIFVQFSGESLELYIRFGRLACLTNALFVIGNAFGQYLIVKQTYWAYGLAPIIYTISVILGTVFLTPLYGPMGPMIGTIAGAVVYVLLRSIACVKDGYRFVALSLSSRAYRGTKHDTSELKQMGILMMPRMIAIAAAQFQLLFFDRIASGMDLGSVTVNAYARNFQAAAVGIIGIALAQSCYSMLSQAAAKNDYQRYRRTLKKGGLMILGLTIPAALILWLLAPVAAWLVNLTHAEVVRSFVIVLGIYALSIPFESLNHLLARAHYAQKRTVLPACTTFSFGIISIICAWWLIPSLGIFALPIGFVVGQGVASLLLGFSVVRKCR